MSATDPSKNHIPGVSGGDLPEKERDAFEEGHDADVPLNKGVVNSEHESLKKEPTFDSEKVGGHDLSSTSSEDGVPADKDLEKGQAVTSEEQTEEKDPNIVDWDGPDDPQNPYNWYADLDCAQKYIYGQLVTDLSVGLARRNGATSLFSHS